MGLLKFWIPPPQKHFASLASPGRLLLGTAAGNLPWGSKTLHVAQPMQFPSEGWIDNCELKITQACLEAFTGNRSRDLHDEREKMRGRHPKSCFGNPGGCLDKCRQQSKLIKSYKTFSFDLSSFLSFIILSSCTSFFPSLSLYLSLLHHRQCPLRCAISSRLSFTPTSRRRLEASFARPACRYGSTNKSLCQLAACMFRKTALWWHECSGRNLRKKCSTSVKRQTALSLHQSKSDDSLTFRIWPGPLVL